MAWFEALAEVGWRPGLERSEQLMRALGSPQKDYRTIHVVGTNGKTSTTLYAAVLLRALGLRTGSLTSPHLDDWTERTRVDGEPIDPGSWEGALATVRDAVEELEAGEPSLGRVSQFEAATAAAFLALARSRVEIAVVEAGLGGRLDSTNVLASELTVLTSIGLDHTEWLGETEAEIAGEKLAVLRPGSTLITGPLAPPIRELASRHAAELEADLIEVGDRGEGEGLPSGRYRRIAFAIASRAVEVIAGPVDERIRRQALADAGLRGRLELVRTDPPVVLDVAHNPDAMAAVVEAVPALVGDRSLIVVFGCLEDRDPLALLEPLVGRVGKLVACRTPGDRGAGKRYGLDPEAIGVAAGRLGLPVEIDESPVDALARAIAEAERIDAAVLVCGSHGLVAELGRLQR